MASEDGVEWAELTRYDYNNETMPEAYKWFSDPNEVTGADATETLNSAAKAVRPGKGYQIQGSVKYDDVGTLQNVSAVKVAAGATLKARGYVKLPTLTVDCENGNGTIDGFDFAEEGVVNLVGLNGNVKRKSAALTFLNTSAETLAKLNDRSKWTVALDGVASDKFNVRIKSDGVIVSQKNLTVIIR